MPRKNYSFIFVLLVCYCFWISRMRIVKCLRYTFRELLKTFEIQLFLICQATFKKWCGEYVGIADFLLARSVILGWLVFNCGFLVFAVEFVSNVSWKTVLWLRLFMEDSCVALRESRPHPYSWMYLSTKDSCTLVMPAGACPYLFSLLSSLITLDKKGVTRWLFTWERIPKESWLETSFAASALLSVTAGTQEQENFSFQISFSQLLHGQSPWALCQCLQCYVSMSSNAQQI